MNQALLRKMLGITFSAAALYAASAGAVPITVDGNLTDLSNAPDTVLFVDTGTASLDGFDIDTVYSHYDVGSSTFTFGFSVIGEVGDSGAFDLGFNTFDSLENYRFLLDLGNNGNFEAGLSLAGDGLADSGANTETANLTSDPGGVTFNSAVSEFYNGVEFSIVGLNFIGDYTVSLGAGASGGPDELVAVSGTVVPVPAAVWLFGSGLLALVGFGRSRRA